MHENASQPSGKTATTDDEASLDDMAMAPPPSPSPSSNSQLNHYPSVQVPPPPGATGAESPAEESASVPPDVNPPEYGQTNASLDAAPSVHAGALNWPPHPRLPLRVLVRGVEVATG